MERLTERWGEDDIWVKDHDYVSAAHRLAAYEDTGLSPESVEALKLSMMGKAISEITEFNGLPIDRLRELAEADKAGRVVVLPCKVGDTVYEVTSRKTISEYRVKAIRVELFCIFIEWDIVAGFVDKSVFGVSVDEIGKTVFLTREEAEKALEARKDGDETDYRPMLDYCPYCGAEMDGGANNG